MQPDSPPKTKPLAELSEADLNNPARIEEIRRTIKLKAGLRALYLEVYGKYAECLSRCPQEGLIIELGSGGSFIKEVIPNAITTDTIHYPGIDQIVDATSMPFANSSVRAIFMMNVFHHIPDVAAFFKEAERCLKPGGRIFIFDQHPGWIGKPILKYAHHEAFDDKTQEWRFASTGPLSSANGALAWIVFRRDVIKFRGLYPQLRLERYSPNSPFRYWLSGGLKKWSLLPKWAIPLASRFDQALVKASPEFGSFVDIELVREAKS